MSGLGTSTQDTASSTAAGVGAQAQPEVQGLLSQLQGLIPNTGVNSTEQGAINQLTSLGQAGNPYATGTTGAVNNLLSGGGANNQTGMVNQAYQQYYNQTNPLASNTNYDPMSTPGIGNQLAALNDQITQNVNGAFSAAGRSGSAYNSKALASGLAAGEAPILTNQYNANVANQQGAAGNLATAGDTAAGLLSNMNQNYVTNQNTGVNSVGTVLNNSTWGPQTALTAQELGQSLPAQNLGLLAQIGIPLAQLYSTNNGTSNTTNTASPIQDFTGIAGGIGALGGLGSATGATTTAANGTVTQAPGSGVLGLLKQLFI